MDDQILMTVTYRLLGGEDPRFADATRTTFSDAAHRLAALPGLIWKIWAMDPERAVGQGVYLFASPEAARAFELGGTLEALSQLPYVTELRVNMARVDVELSLITHARPALNGIATEPVAPA